MAKETPATDSTSQAGNGQIRKAADPATPGPATEVVTRSMVHELGHAFYAWYAGKRITRVVIREEQGSETVHGLAESADTYFDQAELKKWVYSLMAGRIAEEVFLGSASDHGHARDEWELRQIGRIDAEVQTMQNFFRDGRGNLTGFISRFGDPVREILSSEKALECIMAGIDALTRNRELSGVEIAAVFEAHWGEPLPPGVRPFYRHALPEDPKTMAGVTARLNDRLQDIEALLDGQIGRWTGDERRHMDALRECAVRFRFTLGSPGKQ